MWNQHTRKAHLNIFFSKIDILLASPVGFEPARQNYIASQKPTTITTNNVVPESIRFQNVCI